MEFSFPTEHTDPWYLIFKQMMEEMDASGYASREDRNLIMESSATFSWDAGTSELEYDDDIFLHAPQTNKYGYIDDTGVTGPIIIAEGEWFTVDLTRAVSTNQEFVTSVLSQVPNDDNSYALCIRRGGNLYWRNGFVMVDGWTGLIGIGSGLSQDIIDALNNANAPNAGNPFATMADVGGGGAALFRESITPQVTGITNLFVASNNITPGSLRVYRNGMYQGISGDGDPGTGFFEGPAPNQFTMNIIPLIGESLWIEYIIAP
jgi:hypothetical protein